MWCTQVDRVQCGSSGPLLEARCGGASGVSRSGGGCNRWPQSRGCRRRLLWCWARTRGPGRRHFVGIRSRRRVNHLLVRWPARSRSMAESTFPSAGRVSSAMSRARWHGSDDGPDSSARPPMTLNESAITAAAAMIRPALRSCMRRGRWRCQRKYGTRSRLFTVLPVGWLRHGFCRKYLLNRISGGVWVGEVLFGEGDAGGFAGFAGGGGCQDADADEVDADAGEFGVRGQAPGVPSVGSSRGFSVMLYGRC